MFPGLVFNYNFLLISPGEDTLDSFENRNILKEKEIPV